MSENKLPLILEPDVLGESLSYDNLLVVDLSKIENYLKMHVPGAVHIDYPRIIAASRPVMGLVPDDATLESVFSALGIDEHTHVVAYDDEGGGRAARLLWTLEVAGHKTIHCSTAACMPGPMKTTRWKLQPSPRRLKRFM